MRFVTMLLAGAAACALATGAIAADKDKPLVKGEKDPGFNVLDKDNDGSLSRTEAAGNPELARRFKEADKDGDGKLSRTEYLTVMTKRDAAVVKNKVTGDGKDAPRGKDKPLVKGERDPGFNVLDKDRDGSLSRTEAAGNPELASRFKEADKDNDGKLSRMEYLTIMTKRDAAVVKNKVTGDKDREPSAATGGTRK